MTPKPDAPQDDLNPTALLAEALVLHRKGSSFAYDDPRHEAFLLEAQALATIANGAALLMPTPEEVIATYRETAAEVLGEEAEKVARATRILQEARQRGPRHPAITAALEALGDG